MKALLVVNLAFLALILLPYALKAAEYPAPAPPEDMSSYGKHFQRSMTLMATSTPEKRNTVRVLFYGQSIVGQNWHTMVAEDLRKRFPHTDFVIENRALGGFSSQRLVRTMHYDVFPFYPDLLIFHVFGSHTDYEEIIRQVRRQTTAEVIMQTDHANKWPQPRAADAGAQKDWGDRMNYWFLPGFAAKYGCALQPQRWEWVRYLKDNQLEPKALLKDGVHLNEHGRWLMAELLKRFLVHLPDESRDEWKGLVQEHVIGRDVDWDGDRLRLEFEGNRVVALAGPGPEGAARVLIDGKSPAEFPECYAFTRPSGTGGVGWPAVKRISWETPPMVEEWTAEFHDFNDAQTEFRFSISGSVTGADGAGTARKRFVSNSGRIVIEPEDWVFEYCRKVSKKRTADGWKVHWKVAPLFVEEYAPPAVQDAARENQTVLVQGLANGKHTLELVAEGSSKPAIRVIRVYKPPME
jgi:hypothetical protein